VSLSFTLVPPCALLTRGPFRETEQDAKTTCKPNSSRQIKKASPKMVRPRAAIFEIALLPPPAIRGIKHRSDVGLTFYLH
jgi:hypothetical protein